jgi:DNA-binding response OmpR family regulator
MEILLVMDKKLLPLSTLRALLELGYVPVRVPDGAEALRAFARQCFAAIIVDAELPEFGGPELVRYFRGQDARLPIILIGARDNSDYAALARVDGRCRVVRKPLDEVQLLTALAALNTRVPRHVMASDSRVSSP